ncbi:uncharacterized protein LOC116349763 [Contarinia nasturtii]|uniref:uncharacterized protein LOC116349763 n=1 Tax=Contarinia nasturtii TaxID=265458 RepID=UPI0012D3BEDD|nr:uncharacterized protein LOC116349763 [Contarinia nasturtii]
MNLSPLSTCISFLLFIQLINGMQHNGEEDITFSNLLDQFNKKAAEKGFDMGSKLHFIIKISNTVGKLKKKLETPPKEFMDSKKLKRVLASVPKTMTITGPDYVEVNGREFLRLMIGIINDAATENIPNISAEICTEITFIPPHDQLFDDWYKAWDMDPISEQHMIQVYKELPAMTTKYVQLYDLYHKRLGEVEAAVKGVKFLTKLINTDFDRLLILNPEEESDAVQARETVLRLQPLLERLGQHQEHVIRQLTQVRDVLIEYNKDRIKWIEFLVEIRESLTSDRRTTLSKNNNREVNPVVNKKRKAAMSRVVNCFTKILCFRKDL